MLISAAVMAAGTAATIASSYTAPMDTTDYDLLRRTKEEADAESEAAKARIEEARKKEELRQQQMAASGIMTSEVGTEGLSVRNQVLGAPKQDDELEAI